MTISTEADVSARTAYKAPKARTRPVRSKLWFSIVALFLALIVGGILWFNNFRNQMIAQFFASNHPPPTLVTIAEVKSEVLPHLLTAIGDVVAVHQVDVTTDVSGRVTKILFQPGT